MNILGIDPGPQKSAWVLYNGKIPLEFGIDDNIIMAASLQCLCVGADRVAIEMVASYGMPVGKDVFETCVWIGRFMERIWQAGPSMPISHIYRKDIKMNLCHNMRAKDSNIRQALIDRFGPGKDKAIGKKATPGPLYGIKADEWAALAVAVTYYDLLTKGD